MLTRTFLFSCCPVSVFKEMKDLGSSVLWLRASHVFKAVEYDINHCHSGTSHKPSSVDQR